MQEYVIDQMRGWTVNSVYGHDHHIRRVLDRLASHPEATGESDLGTRNTIYNFAINLRPRRVLEIGTHIGNGALVIGEALKRNGFGKLITLEPTEHYRHLALSHIAEAGLSDWVTVVPQFSFQPDCQRMLQSEAPFELIFVDGAHDFASAYGDIEFCYGLLAPSGIILVHDTGPISASLDQTGKGGPRQALREFAEHKGITAVQFDPPVWPNNCGLGMIVKSS